MNAPADKTDRDPVTVVVRRRVKNGCEAEFEAAMRDFITFAMGSPDHLSIHVLRPAATGPADYTVVDKFATGALSEPLRASTDNAPRTDGHTRGPRLKLRL